MRVVARKNKTLFSIKLVQESSHTIIRLHWIGSKGKRIGEEISQKYDDIGESEEHATTHTKIPFHCIKNKLGSLTAFQV